MRDQNEDSKDKWIPIAQKSIQADKLEWELNSTILSEIQFYTSVVDTRLEAAEVMNLVSDLLPNGIWLLQYQMGKDSKGLELTLTGASEFIGTDSKLVEIQKFANLLKTKLEEILTPEPEPDSTPLPVIALPGLQNVPGLQSAPVQNEGKIELNLTTSSEKSPEEKKQLLKFVATFKTTGFSPVRK